MRTAGEISSRITDRFLGEQKLAENAFLLEDTEIKRLREETRAYFSAQLLQTIGQSNIFRIPTIEDAKSLLQLQEALRAQDDEAAATLLTQISCPIVEKKAVQKPFRKNDSNQAIVILRTQGNRNLSLAIDDPAFEFYKEAGATNANNVMIIHPGCYGGIDKNGAFIYGIDEAILKQNFEHVGSDTWQTKPHSLVFATAPGEYYGLDHEVVTTSSHEGKQNAKPYQFYCHDDLEHPAKAYNADPERFIAINDDARLLFNMLMSAPVQTVKEMRKKWSE